MGKKRKKSDAELAGPPPPLTQETQEQVWALLEENGGQLSGGIVSTKIEGVKKAQLKDHFEIHEVDGGNYHVLLPGVEFDADTALVQSAKKKSELQPRDLLQEVLPVTKKIRALEDVRDAVREVLSSPELPELSPDTVAGVETLLEECEGQVSLGTVASRFPGTKKAQLEQHFILHIADGNGECYVLSPYVEFDPVKAAANKVQGANRRPELQPPDPRQEVLPSPALPELSPDTVAGVETLLEEFQGQAPLGVVATRFPGTKKAQLEQYFILHIAEGSGECFVLGPDVEFDPVLAAANKAAMAAAREGARGVGERHVQASSAPAPPLEEDQVQAITNLLEEHGGLIKGGTLATAMPGIKKAQVIPHFRVETDWRGEYYVTNTAGALVPALPTQRHGKGAAFLSGGGLTPRGTLFPSLPTQRHGKGTAFQSGGHPIARGSAGKAGLRPMRR